MAKKISVVIPNYNGCELLEKNLPAVIENCPGCEIIVVDDASTDDSVSFLKENFKKITVLENKQNIGFASSVNAGVKYADGELVLLLNSDVKPNAKFLEVALSHFENDTEGGLFSVGLADKSHENDKIAIRGRGGANFKRGFVNHFKLPSSAGETLWTSGGSSLVDKNKFQKLGGFDPIFKPFYWEDIDLCWRAQKSGYKCIFEPDAKVEHFHEEGAIKKLHKPFKIKSTSYKNQFIFVWKNITDYFLLTQHIFWLPYHFAKALLAIDGAFFVGFLWALSKLPQLILNYPLSTINYKLTDQEVLAKFEKH